MLTKQGKILIDGKAKQNRIIWVSVNESHISVLLYYLIITRHKLFYDDINENSETIVTFTWSTVAALVIVSKEKYKVL